MITKETRRNVRSRVHKRIRKKVSGTTERPRLCVFKSNKHIYAQVVDDTVGKTLAASSTLDAELRKSLSEGNKCNISAAAEVGKDIASKAKEKGINRIVFDRGGYIYHGIVKALADAAREQGLEF